MIKITNIRLLNGGLTNCADFINENLMKSCVVTWVLEILPPKNFGSALTLNY